MMYNKDDVIYILENNTTIRKGKIARKQGDNYIIQLIGSCGALTMPEDQPVVEALVGEGDEVIDALRGLFGVQLGDNLLAVRHRECHDGICHGWFTVLSLPGRSAAWHPSSPRHRACHRAFCPWRARSRP